MRSLVFVLVLANLLFFAFAQGYFGRPDNPDASRGLQQVHPERIAVVARGEPPSAAKDRPAEEPRQVESKPVEQDVAAAAPAPAPAPAPESCLVWSGLSARDAERIAGLIDNRFGDFKVEQRKPAVEASSWWVFMPPFPDKAAADKKAAELKRLNVGDYFIIQEAGPNRFAISLGVFSSEAGANERLAELRGKGVRTARVGPRGGKEAAYAVEARGPADRAAALRQMITAQVPANGANTCP